MHISLQNKVAIVTGAASGFGYAIAQALRDAGATVVIADIQNAEKAAQEIGAHSITFDVADVDACRAAVQQTVDEHSQLDILVNNAGICPLKDIDEVDQAFFDHLFAVNLRGAYFLSQAAAAHMKPRQTGRIINISSVGGRTGGTLAVSVYAATKAALFSVTKSFAKHLAPYGTVNTIAPGPAYTPLTDAWGIDETLQNLETTIPLQRLGTPQDIANATVFLASDAASYITGAILDVNGGFRMD